MDSTEQKDEMEKQHHETCWHKMDGENE